MAEHPQYAMWKARYEAERAADRERAARRAQREASEVGLEEAWRSYKVHWRAGLLHRGIVWPAWWNMREWLRLLLGKDQTH